MIRVGDGYLRALLRRQLLLALRRPVEAANPLLFFALVMLLFPLGLGPQADQLARFAPGIFWIIALLSTLLAAGGLFREDYEDGCLEQLLLLPRPLYLSCLGYALAHWLTGALPLILLAPLFASMLQLPTAALPTLLVSLLFGTGVLSLLSTIGAALTLGVKRGGTLLSLLILPLYLPVLILGSGALRLAAHGESAQPQILVLAGLLSLAIALAPFACAGGLRLSVEAG